MSIFLFSYIKNRDDIKQIFNSIFVSLVFLLLYLIISTPVELWGTFAVGNEQGIHKNTIGLNLAIGSIFSFYYSNHSKHTFIYRVLSIIFFVFSLLAGSRKVLILIALVSILYAFLTSKNEKLIKRIIGIGLLSIGAIVIIYSNKLLYDMLGARMINLFDKFLLGVDIGIEEDKSIWERQYYINSAIELWLINPITILIGNGIDGFRTYMGKIGYSHVAYSHCNYIELLCNHGIIGFILYYYNKIRYCITGFRIKNNNTICDLLVVFMICGMVIEYSMVSYYSELFQIVFIMSFCAIAITKKSFNTNDV
ncbi:MAG: O-antigen ligase family protein [Bacteroidota bacterium]|nr:O-antigen ligase family protein [Bacteroidota bacterium]